METMKPPRIGFYPACARDVRASAILRPYVDRIIYCDVDERLAPYWERISAGRRNGLWPATGSRPVA